MPLGVGGGVNLGAATVFLFVDASGMRRNLLQAEKDLQDFQRKQAAAAASLNKATAQSSVARNAAQVSKQATDPAFINFQKQIDAAVQRATTSINASYKARDAALQAHARVVASVGQQEAREIANLKSLEAQRAAAVTKANALQQKLTLTQNNPNDPRALNARQAQIATLNLQDSVQQIQRLDAAIAQSKRDIAQYQQQIQQSANATNQAITRASGSERAALTDLTAAVRNEVSAFKGLATAAGPQFQRLGTAVENSGRALIASIQKVEQAESRLTAAQRARASANGANLESAVRAEQVAAQARQRALAQLDASEKRYAGDKARLTQQLIDNDRKQAQAAQQAAEAQIKAQQEATFAAKQQAADQLAKGLQAAQGTAIATATAIGVAGKAFISFEKEMVNIASISPEINNSLADTTKQVEALATQLGQSPEDLAAGLYEIAQAGFDGQQAMDLLALATKAAVAGQTSVETAARPLIAAMNAYHLTTEQTKEALDQMFEGVTAGIFSFEDLAQQFGDNVSIAAALGVQVDELQAAYIVLTKRGNSLAESTTQVNAVMNAFLKPSDDLTQAVKELTGEEATLYFRTHSLGEVLALVQTMFDRNADAAGKLFPNLRALRGIFGLTGDEVTAYNTALEQVDRSSDGVGVAAQVLQRQMQSTAFQLSQARQEMQVAAITLGSAVAPAILKAAQAGAGIARLFDSLPQPIQQLSGDILVFVGGATTLLTILYRVGATIKDTIIGFKGLIATIQGSTAAMRIFSIVTNPLLIALGLAAAAAFLLYQRHQAQEQAVKDLTDAYDKLNSTLKDNAKSGEFTAAEQEAQTKLTNAVKDEIKAREDAVGALNDQSDALYALLQIAQHSPGGTATDFAGLLGTKGAEVTADQIQDRYNTVLDLLTEIPNEKEDAARAITALDKIVADSTFDWEKNGDALLKQIAYYHQVGAGAGVMADFLENIVNHLGDYEKSASKAAQVKIFPGETEFKTLDDFFGGVDDNLSEAQKALQKLVLSAENATGAMADFSDPLKFLQGQIGDADAGINKILLTLNAVGQIDLSHAEQQALVVANAVDAWQQAIDRVNTSIGENNTRMQAAQSIASQVEASLGTQEDGYEKLNKMLKNGLITQDEYNQIKEAGNYLNKQAQLTTQDETVAIAKQLPDLAAYVKGHEDALGRYRDLTPEQRGFVESLKDERNQMLIMTGIMVKFAEAMGIIPHEVVTKFFADVSKADPVIASLYQDLGLIPKEVTTDAKIDTTDAQSQLASLDKKIAETRALLDEPDVINNDARIEQVKQQLADLRKQRNEINVDVEADPGPLDDTREAIKGLGFDADKTEKKVSDDLENMFRPLRPNIKTLRDMAEKALPSIVDAASVGLDDPLGWLTRGMSDAEKSIEDVLLQINHLNNSPFRLSNSQVQALRTTDALNELNDSLKAVTDQIGEASDEISTFNGYISLVDDTLGSGKNTLDNYQKQLALGKIKQGEFNKAVRSGDAALPFAKARDLLQKGLLTQDEYNRAVAAGTEIQQISKQAIDEENAAIAKSLPILDARIKAQRNAQLAYNDLTDSQKTFIAGINEEGVQSALTTTLMLAQLESLGAVAAGTTKKVANAYASINPTFGAIAKDIGLIAGTHEVGITVNTKLAKKPEDLVKEQTPRDGVPVKTKLQVDRTSANAVKTPDDRTTTLHIDTSQADQALNDFDTTFKQHADSWAADAGTDGWTAGKNFIDNLVTSLTAQAASIAPTVDTNLAALDAAKDSALTYGQNAGLFFVTGILLAMQNNAPSLTTEVTATANALAGGNGIAQNLGKSLGQTYLLGISRAMASNISLLQDALHNNDDSIDANLASELAIAESYGETLGRKYLRAVVRGINRNKGTLDSALTGTGSVQQKLVDAANGSSSLGTALGRNFMLAARDAVNNNKGALDESGVLTGAGSVQDKFVQIANGTASIGTAAGSNFDGGARDGITNNSDEVSRAVNAILGLLSVSQIANNLGKSVGQQYDLGIKSGISTNQDSIKNAIIGPDGITGLLHDVSSKPYGVYVGSQYLVGILNGVNDDKYRKLIRLSGAGVGNDLVNSTLDALDAHSPSRRGIYVGQTFSQGVAIGVKEGGDDVVTSGSDIADNLNYAAEQIFRVGGDKTPAFLVNLGKQLQDLADDEGELDPNALRAYAEQLRGFQGGGEAVQKVASYLDQIAGIVQDRASNSAINAASQFGQDFTANLDSGSSSNLFDNFAKGAADAGGRAGKSAGSSFSSGFNSEVGGIADSTRQFQSFGQALSQARINLADLFQQFLDNKGVNQDLLKTLPEDWQQSITDLTSAISAFGGVTDEQAGMLDEFLGAELKGDLQTAQQMFLALPEAIRPAMRELAFQLNTLHDPAALKAMHQSFDDTASSADRAAKSVSDLPDALKRLSKLTDDAKNAARDYLNLMMQRADPDQIVAAFQRMQAAIGDRHTISVIQQAAVELRKGVPKGFGMDQNFNFFPLDAQNAAKDQAGATGEAMGRALATSLQAGFTGMDLNDWLLNLANSKGGQFLANMQATLASGAQLVVDEFGRVKDQYGNFLTQTFQLSNQMVDTQTQAGQQIGAALADGLQQSTRTVQSQQQQAGRDVATSLLDGFMMGTGETFPQFMARMAQLGPSIIATVHRSLGISSPSKAFRDIGINVGQSFIDSAYKTLVNGSQRLRDAAKVQTEAFSDEFSRGMKEVQGGQPIGSTRNDLKMVRSSRGVGAGAGNKNTQVHAPISVGVTVNGANGNAQELASEIKQQVWSNLVASIGQVWAQAEGAV